MIVGWTILSSGSFFGVLLILEALQQHRRVGFFFDIAKVEIGIK